MEYAIAYVAIIFILQVIGAIRTPREDCQVVIFATVFWPLMVVLIAGAFLLDYISWDFDIVRSDKILGFRRPTNPAARGFAVSVLTVEFQFYSKRKE